jgi:transposase-like protein
VQPLERVRLAARQRAKAERSWRQAILAARRKEIPLRAIAEVAGVSHVRVLQIEREAGDP